MARKRRGLPPRYYSTLLGWPRHRTPLVPHLHVRPWRVVVVREDHQPLLGNRLGVEAVPIVNASQWVQIVSHHPGGIEMMRGRNQVAGVADGGSPAAHQHDLHVAGVSGKN